MSIKNTSVHALEVFLKLFFYKFKFRPHTKNNSKVTNEDGISLHQKPQKKIISKFLRSFEIFSFLAKKTHKNWANHLCSMKGASLI